MSLRAIPAHAESFLASAWAGIARMGRRAPFGIGTVVMLLCAVMVAATGAVLAIGTPERATSFAFGQLRPYADTPTTAWSLSSSTLPNYASDSPIEIAATHDHQWLLSYPSGIGRAYLLVDRATGKSLWDRPIDVGVGQCGITTSGVVGCAARASESLSTGFYVLDDSGKPGQRSDLGDSTGVIGVGQDFLRISSSANRVALHRPSGEQLWSASYDSTPTASSTPNGLLEISTVAAHRALLDPATGKTLLECDDCSITSFPTGITVDHIASADHEFEAYSVTNGVLNPQPTERLAHMRSVTGPSTMAVLTPVGATQMQAAQGSYLVVNPATPSTGWQLSESELSKANTRPCGSYVAFARKDRTRAIYTLADGTFVGSLPAPSISDPDTNLDYLRCVGSSNDLILFASESQLTAINPAAGRIAWTLPIAGQMEAVDGYLAVREGTSLRVFAPNTAS